MEKKRVTILCSGAKIFYDLNKEYNYNNFQFFSILISSVSTICCSKSYGILTVQKRNFFLNI